MGVKPEQQQMQVLLTEAITVLCKNGLQYRSHFNVEGLLGITLDDEDVFLVSIKQTVKGDQQSPVIDVQFTKTDLKADNTGLSVPKVKHRKKRKKSSEEGVKAQLRSDKDLDKKDDTSSEENGDNENNEDNFDDNVSSPGEVIVVKEESLSDSENAPGGSRLEKKRKKSLAQSPSYGSVVDKEDANHGIFPRNNGPTPASANENKLNSSNSPAFPGWETMSAYSQGTPNSDVQTDSQEEPTYPNQVCQLKLRTIVIS